jgi:hypothetical protein
MLKAFDENLTRRAMLLARATLEIEADAIRALHARLATDDSVGHAVGLLLQCRGRVVVSGIAVRPHRAQDRATLSSTGTPAMFVHPAEGPRRPRHGHRAGRLHRHFDSASGRTDVDPADRRAWARR